jgi:uncharacterized protein YyaL (SSP411 family)
VSESADHPVNRLAKESSPYLLQHQHNPVDWYPWGEEAFEAAREQDKPIFLSVGYSTCYWCHVMERQSFENQAVADEMNRRFINIKVDREERPDVDQLYMMAVQLLTRHGGWPMSVFLMPDLRPFYGGTYFPPSDMHGRPGFVTILRGIDDAWKQRRGDVVQTADQLKGMLHQLAEPARPRRAIQIDAKLINDWIDRSTGDFDSTHGGFGGAPKFPRQTLLELLLVQRGPGVNLALRTLDAMAAGGIRDHLGGGFHRYSTDARWLVPHFEIMLYDNAMLAWCYVEAHRQTGEARHAQVARGIFDFVLREMTDPAGGFYTAFDAEVDAMEGQSYLWTARQIEQVLGQDDAKLFNHVYGVDRGANFADPHHGDGVPDQNILYLPNPAELTAELEQRLSSMRHRLYLARQKRKQPLLDTKILTSWNALMIRALAHGGQVFNEPRYLQAACRAAEFLLDHHRDPLGELYRTSRDVRPKHHGFLDDYAFFAQALLALHQATGQTRWRQHAMDIANRMLDQFQADNAPVGGLYFTRASSTDLIVRQKVGADSPLPSGNAVAAMVLLQLGRVRESAMILEAFAAQLDEQAEAMSAMAQAAFQYVGHSGPLMISSGESSTDHPPSPRQLAETIVNLSTDWADPTRLLVRMEIASGYHVNAHEPSAGLLATELTVMEEASHQVRQIEYPPGVRRTFEFSSDPIDVYENSITLAVDFNQPQTGRPVSLSLRYQACDERACLPPVSRQWTTGA